jgi:hypothetical protein
MSLLNTPFVFYLSVGLAAVLGLFGLYYLVRLLQVNLLIRQVAIKRQSLPQQKLIVILGDHTNHLTGSFVAQFLGVQIGGNYGSTHSVSSQFLISPNGADNQPFSLRDLTRAYLEFDSSSPVAVVSITDVSSQFSRALITAFKPECVVIPSIDVIDEFHTLNVYNQVVSQLPKPTTLILNWDNWLIRKLDYAPGLKMMRIGIHSPNVEYKVKNVSTVDGCTSVAIEQGMNSYKTTLSLASESNVLSLVNALACVASLGFKITTLMQQSSALGLPGQVFGWSKVGQLSIADDSANTTYVGLQNALRVVTTEPGASIMVLDYSTIKRWKKELIATTAESIAQARPRLVIIIDQKKPSQLIDALVECNYNRYDILLSTNNSQQSIINRIRKELSTDSAVTVLLEGQKSQKILEYFLPVAE